MRFGLHVSIEGSFAHAPRRAKELGCECFQMFAGSPRSFRRRKPRRAEADEFRALVAEHDLGPVVVHAGYMLHLTSARPSVARGSRTLLRREVEIASVLGADYYVMHLGSAGEDREKALDVLCEALDEAAGEPRARAGGDAPTVLLENSARAATGLGASFAEIGGLIGRLRDDSRFGIAFDTAHAVGAGYDLSSGKAVSASVRRILREAGRRRVRLVHANDSRGKLGSGVDRHEHVGRGEMGEKGFRALLAQRSLAGLPFILETPVDRPGDDGRNLARLRKLAGAGRGGAKRKRTPAKRRRKAKR